MRLRFKVEVDNGKLLTLILGCLVTATSFADRTPNQGWVKENFVSRTNEWKLAERRYALFILDLTGANPKKLAVLVSPDLCFDGRWLGEENEEVVWSYARADASGPERTRTAPSSGIRYIR